MKVKFLILLNQQKVHNEQTEHQNQSFANRSEKVTFHVKLWESQFGPLFQLEHLLISL